MAFEEIINDIKSKIKEEKYQQILERNFIKRKQLF